MPYSDDVSAAALVVVGKEVGRWLPRLGGGLHPAAAVTITSSLRVWKLSSAEVADLTLDELGRMAVDTGRTHHQVAVGGEPTAYARSVVQNGETVVEQVTVSPTAKDIETAIQFVDAEVAEDDLARLLEAPAYDVRVIWLVDKAGTGRVVVAQASFRLPDLQPPPRLISEKEFLAQLRSVAPAEGMGVG